MPVPRCRSVVRSRCARVALVFAIAAFVLGGFVVNDRASAATVVTNTALATNNFGMLEYIDDLWAVSFTTGAAPSILNAAGLIITQDSAVTVQFEGFLMADAGGSPDATLETFANQPSLPTGSFSQEIVFNSVGTALAASTRYWIAVHQITANEVPVFWDATDDTTETSAFGWTIGNNDMHVSFEGDPWLAWGLTGKMRIDATFEETPAIPAPAALSAGVVLLTALAHRRRRA